MWQPDQVEFHPHARLRMAERRISENQVLHTLNEPDRRYPSYDGRTVAERDTMPGNILRVIYVERLQGVLVLSVIRIAPKRT
ncbi:MAG TPA: DUF4258 domain-containing protein [Thermomicrobiaceae bacterium]|nr:DUF4258 domain-containing protein [Thermomicrobiaceae bacterium]